MIIYPPAIAGGTDCIQQKSLTFEAKLMLPAELPRPHPFL
jgi:hypothetical protein